MNFDLFTILAMTLIVLLALIGMSRSIILFAHEQTLGRLLNTPLSNMEYSTSTPMLFQNAWGVIRRILKNSDNQIYNSVDEILAKVEEEIIIEIKEANSDPLTRHLLPLLKEARTNLILYRDHVQNHLKQNPMITDTYSRQRVFMVLNI